MKLSNFVEIQRNKTLSPTMMKHKLLSMFLLSTSVICSAAEPVDYVNTLVGTQSKYELSTGNTLPLVAMPWGMNSWTPQTGKNGDGWS